MNEYDFEPIRGLPGPLPPGEHILWQGSPSWWGLSKRVFHARKAAIYCGFLLVWHGITAAYDGATVGAAVLTSLALTPYALALLALLVGLGWLFARVTVYTITNRRVMMRYGVALSMTVNLPLRLIGSAALKVDRAGVGDIPLTMTGEDRVSYLALWPHVRPWRLRRAEPMLRALPEAAKVGEILAGALHQALIPRARRVAAPAPADDRDRALASAA